MCLNLIGSKFQSIKEVETILNSGLNITEQDIIEMKDNRQEIEQALQSAQSYKEIVTLYG